MGSAQLEKSLGMKTVEDYVQGSTTFSKQEMEVIRELLSYTDTKAALAGMSVKDVGVLESKLGKRESKEFLEKLKQGDAE